MVSFWGPRSRRADNNVSDHDRASSASRQRHREPDERTRLLPRGSGEGYLSPDDPAVRSTSPTLSMMRATADAAKVSPYNLWSVRALRLFSLIFLALSFVWWVFLLVSIFVSPPMMHTRGSGFFNFAYTTLTVGNLIIGLLFFAVPSRPMTIWGAVLSVLLVVDTLLILSVPRLRVEEGWVGIASVLWATVIATYNVVQTQTVARGKEEEEERLTGRVETRRTLLEWFAVLAETIVMGVMTLVVILLTATLVLRARDASLAPPGKRYLVDNQKYEVHLACVGNNTINEDDRQVTTILVEAGEGPVEDSLQPFIDNAYRNGIIDRYCYWDRPGIAWSDNAPSPHSAGMSADAFSEALALAGEEGPWILVSAGIGSIYSRIFASRHVGDVRGMMLIDPLHEDSLHRIGSPGRGFVLWCRGIISPLGLDRLAGAIFKGRTREDRIYGRSAYQNGRFIKAQLQENLVAESMTASEIASARHVQQSLDTPLVVVSSGVEMHKSEQWAKQQEEMAHMTDNLVAWDVVGGAPHEVWTTFEGRNVLERRLGQILSVSV